MAKHLSLIPVMVLLLVVVSLASLCDAARVRLAGDSDDYERNFTRCQLMLEKGAPKCYKEVYRNNFLPRDHVQCCKNYMRMDEEEHSCWDYLFDGPGTTRELELNLDRCKLEQEPPVDRRNRTFVECRTFLNEGDDGARLAPDCWEEVYFRHKLPKNHTDCCWNFVSLDYRSPICWAYLFQYQKATLVLKDTLEKCHKLFH